MPTSRNWDVFVSYASEDKESIARPLVLSLQNAGLRVWFDEFALSVGDSLSHAIDTGLSQSRFGIVIISEHFLAKRWPQKELAGLFAKETDIAKVILPVWHGVTIDDLKRSSPILADRVAVNSNLPIDELTKVLIRAMELPVLAPDISGLWHGRTGRLKLFQSNDLYQGDYEWDGNGWVGQLVGTLNEGILKFGWTWRRSVRHGYGFFRHYPDKGLLEGGWRFAPRSDAEMFDLSDIQLTDHLQPWSFLRKPD